MTPCPFCFAVFGVRGRFRGRSRPSRWSGTATLFFWGSCTSPFWPLPGAAPGSPRRTPAPPGLLLALSWDARGVRRIVRQAGLKRSCLSSCQPASCCKSAHIMAEPWPSLKYITFRARYIGDRCSFRRCSFRPVFCTRYFSYCFFPFGIVSPGVLLARFVSPGFFRPLCFARLSTAARPPSRPAARPQLSYLIPVMVWLCAVWREYCCI